MLNQPGWMPWIFLGAVWHSMLAMGTEPANDFLVERSMTYGGGFTDLTTIQLGDLMAGGKGDILLKVTNASKRPFKINRISASCSCVSAKSMGDLIPVDGSIDVVIQMKTPTTQSRAEFQQFVRIVESEEAAIQIGLAYRLAGAACFTEKTTTQFASQEADVCKFQLPLLITEPAKPENISVSATGDLAALKTRIGMENGQHYLVCEMPVSTKGDLAIGGEIQLIESSTQIRSSIPCYINREGKVVVSPKFQRFNKNQDNWEAVAIVRSNTRSIENDLQRELAIACQCNDGTKVAVASRKIGKHVYRVVLTLEKRRLPLDEKRTIPTSLKWQIVWDGGIAELETEMSGLDSTYLID